MPKFAEAEATLVPSGAINSVPGLQPGAFVYVKAYGTNEEVGIIYRCPCGCGEIGVLRFRHARNPDNRPTWELSGTRERPTLTPSVLHWTYDKEGAKQEHWHGFLTNGRWVSA